MTKYNHTICSPGMNMAFVASISTLFVLVCLAHSVRRVSGVALSLEVNQQQQQHQEAYRHKDQLVQNREDESKLQSSEEDQLLSRLLQLTASKATNEDELESAQVPQKVSYKAKKLLSSNEKPLVNYGSREQQSRAALKRQLHKLVDDIVDSASPAGSTILAGDKIAVNKPMARKRQLIFVGSPGQSMSDDKVMPMVKRKPALDDLDGQPQSTVLSNGLDKEQQQHLQQQQQSQQTGAKQTLVDMAEHQRRILDDVAGIRRDSVFTTNNHLGIKGVPKFGYDEQF